jgi:ribose 5-phosphate isomerase B
MIAIVCNCSGYKLKKEVLTYLEEKKIDYKDFGTFDEETLDDPEAIKEACKSIQTKKCDVGIFISGSGFGMAMFANKFKGIRSVDCFNIEGAKRAKAHYNANVLALPAEFISLDTAINIIRDWLGTEVLGGRYKDRMDVIQEIEKENMK